MDSKLLQDELLNYQQVELNSDEENEVPSYQMQTISSRLKMVAKEVDRERHSMYKKHGLPFTVGSAFVTHNVKLLKQETLQKLKAMFLSYKNENDINSSNINELRLLKNDIDSFRIESQKLKYYASRRRQFLKTVTSRYMHWNTNACKRSVLRYKEQLPHGQRRKEKLNMLCHDAGGGGSQHGKELADLLKLHHRLETLFKNNKAAAATTLQSKSGAGAQKLRNCQEIENPPVEANTLNQEQGANTISRSTSDSSTTKCSVSYQCRRKQKLKYQRSHQELLKYGKDDGGYMSVENEGLRSIDMTPHEVTQMFEIPHQKSFAPSIYSRKKRRKHVRKYMPSESAVENIQEHDDYSNDNDHDETQSNKNMTKTEMKVNNVPRNVERPKSVGK